MAEEGGRSRLGRGLAALIADSSAQMPTSPAPEELDSARTTWSFTLATSGEADSPVLVINNPARKVPAHV